MAFSRQRGRPPQPKRDVLDHGTPELQHKRALQLTDEPIDLCLNKRLITPEQHRSALHLRWLYTLRYGAPVVTTHYENHACRPRTADEPQAWRTEREQEYLAAVTMLQQAKRYECVMRVCIFNETPAFLNRMLLARSWNEPALATRIGETQQLFSEGLQLLTQLWRKDRSASANRMK